ncbi:hypothetical protein [Pseudomonas luteola]|uniref:Uncharacterized protein n=1 Tax=Pseudomonas luteola TaxID=47886 RepID=A0ABS0FRS2_PSELU|nr:hypothetical protein [Pseudomonas zeshuii]MBF8643085.1 hypothetical protein [Pseudomonas zeshuii]
MPAPLDLTGRRFGRLRVLAMNGRVKFGREQTAWLVVCNCGRQETLAQSLLTQRGWRECSWCQRPECVICGNKVPSDRPRSNTCSDACASKQRRRTNLEHYHRRAADPEFNRRRYQRLADRMARDTELAERVRQIQRESGKRWRNDPANKETIRQYMAAHYAANRVEIQARRRARLDAMTPEQLAHWRVRIRTYQRLYARRYRDQIRRDPERHRAYLDRMREYRRRGALEVLKQSAANVG